MAGQRKYSGALIECHKQLEVLLTTAMVTVTRAQTLCFLGESSEHQLITKSKIHPNYNIHQAKYAANCPVT